MGVLLSMRYSHTQSSSSSPSSDLILSPTSSSFVEMQDTGADPSPSFFDEPQSPSSTFSPLSEHEPVQQPKELAKDEVRQYMHEHSIKGAKMAKSRQPFVGETLPFESPVDPEVEFGIKRVGNREHIAYRNLSSKIRYIQSEGDDTFVSEKDYPAGDMSVSTILLALASWNIEEPDGKIVEINRENLIAYTKPEELEFLHDKVLEVNPILTGKDKAKNS